MSIEKIESKLDQLLEMTVQTKIDLVELKADVRATNDKVEEHISQDEKIIARMTPMIEHYEYQQKKKNERTEKMKLFGLRTVYLTAPLGIGTGLYRLVLFLKSLV